MKEDLSKYDNLECPHCGKLCKPVKELKNGTVVYESHECTYAGGRDKYFFAIDVNGDLIE